MGRLLESAHGEDVDPYLSEIAHHLFLASPLGDAGQAVEYLVRAGDRASAVLGYEDAAIHFQRALELLAAAGDGSTGRRGELLLRLGDAQWRSGDGGARAADVRARDRRRAALGRAGVARASGARLRDRARRLPALRAIPASAAPAPGSSRRRSPPFRRGDSALRSHLLAHLALEMWSGFEPVERRVAISEEAIAMARRLGDAEALLTGLHSRHWALTGPGRARERLAHTEEMLRVAKESLKPETEFLAHDARLHCYLELCDRWGTETEIQAMTAITERIRQPFHRWHTVLPAHPRRDARRPFRRCRAPGAGGA